MEFHATAGLESLVSILADSLRSIWLFPEWGGHNRALLRAAGLAQAAAAFPEHAEASKWASLADELAEESWGRWSIEDAMLYQVHWLRAMIPYAEGRGRLAELLGQIQPRLHLKAMTQLISPLGILPDFGNFCVKRSEGEWDGKCLEEYDRYVGTQEFMPYAKDVSAKAYDFNEKGECVETDYRRIMKIVRDAGYKGYVGIEYEGDKLSEPDGIRATLALLYKVGAELSNP